MKCLNCNGIEFERKKLRLPTTVKNQPFEVIIPCNVCKKCKTPLMDTEQMNLLRRAASDKYREEHHLLTSQEIIQRREHLKLSQLGFAEYLKVGEASVKRWESYYIQDASQDDHIRMKCDLVTARNNYNILLSSYDKPDMYNGNKPFSLPLFRNTALYLQNKLKKCYPYLNYLHFYIDFLHFKRHKQSITGVKYISLRAGPCPYEFIFFQNPRTVSLQIERTLRSYSIRLAGIQNIRRCLRLL